VEIKLGVFTNVYLGHKMDEKAIYSFCFDLNSDKLLTVSQFLKKYNNSNSNQKVWEIKFDDFGRVFYVEVYGFIFRFSEKICGITIPRQWKNFLLKNEVQKEIREITFEVMDYFKSSFVIYVPDTGHKESGIMDFLWKEDEEESKDIHFIKNWLMNNCGPSKKYIKDIYQKIGDYWDSEGYYIDDFKDFIDIKTNS
jgi:hypothetical protein